MKLFFSFILCLCSALGFATSFTCPLVSGNPALTSMAGHSVGDTCLIPAGAFTSYNFQNLIGIVILPQGSNTSVYITGEGFFKNNKFIEWGYVTGIGSATGFMNGDASNNNNCWFHHHRQINQGTTCYHFDGSWPWTVGDTTTLQLYKIRMDSIYEYNCPSLLRSGFGDMTQNHPNPSNVSDSIIITRLLSLATSGTGEEGTEVRFAGCFRANFHDWVIISTTQRGPSGDDGNIYIKGGDGTFYNIYRYGGPGAVIRIYGCTQTAFPRNVIAYNINKQWSTCYSNFDFRFDVNTAFTGVQSCGWEAYGLTMGNSVDNAGGYGANLAIIGNIDNTKPHKFRNLVGWNIQKCSGCGSFLIKDQSGGTYNFSDTANTQYWGTSALAKMDTTTILYSNVLGTFATYAPSALSTGAILHGGVTNPYSNTDYVGNPMRVPPDLGYMQLNTNTPTVGLTFTQLTGYTIDPNRGPQNWGLHTWNDITQPTIPPGNTVAKNYYNRFNWRDIESSTVQGSYSWTVFDNYVNQAIDNGAMFSFGVMLFCNGCGTLGEIPVYVQNLMTAEGKPGVNVGGAGFIYPNYQSVQFKTRYCALLRAIANHINTTSRNGILYRKAFLGFDLRHAWNFGECGDPIATGVGSNQYPASAQITDAYFNSMVDSAAAIYPNVQLTIPMGYFANNNNFGNSQGNASTQAAWYALTKRNNYGAMGWRRDNIGDSGYNGYLTRNLGTYNPGTGTVSLAQLTMNQWKVAPIGGEPSSGFTQVTTNGGCDATHPYCDFHIEDTVFHISNFGNGNASYSNADGAAWTNLQAYWRAASAEQGYRLIIDSGRMTTNISSGNAFNMTLYWRNSGLAPVYETWRVTYELRNDANGNVAWRGISKFTPKLFLPNTSDSTVSENFSMNNAVPGGTYTMYIKIIDTAGYKAALPLYITGRTADGAYPVRSNIQIVPNATTDSLTLVYIWGESNASGNAPNSGAPPAELGNRPEIQILDHNTSHFTVLNISGNVNQDGFSDAQHHNLFLSLANQVDSGRLPNPTYGVLIGVSGAPICQWIPTVGYGPNNGSNCRSGLIGLWEGWIQTYADAGSAAMIALGKPYRPWVLGTEGLNDAYVYGTNIDTFTAKFRLFKSLFRTRYSKPTLQFLVTNFNNPPALTATPPWLGVFRDSLISGDPYSHAIPVLTATYMDGGSHYDYNGFKVVGHNMVDTMLALQGFPAGGGVTPPPPHPNPTAVINPVSGNITLPTNTFNLSGATSFAVGCNISAYLWTQVSGPNTAGISTPTASSTNLTGLIAGTYVFQLRVTDDSLATNSTTAQVVVNPTTVVGTTVFTNQTPTGDNLNDNLGPIELGMKFRSSVDGYVIGVRFYKTTGNTGTHIGELYSRTGTRLAQVAFTGETTNGWQTAYFSTPVAITANTTYVIAYFSPNNFYTSDNNWFNTATINGTLTGLADGTDGNNGLYKYTATPAFPNATFQKANYWVDVVFSQNQQGQCNCHPRCSICNTIVK